MNPRTTKPSNNKYYIRQVNGGYNGAVQGYPTDPTANVLANCVGYANGRFNEIGAYGYCKYQLVCNAENFIENARSKGLKISNVPTLGGVMVWKRGATLSGSDGAGHVAVVEKIYSDGSILTSESGWGGSTFFTRTRKNDGRWGQSSDYTFRGCIVNPAVKDSGKLTVDGLFYSNSVKAMQSWLGTYPDGVLSDQLSSCRKYLPNIAPACIFHSYGSGGSAAVKALQSYLNKKGYNCGTVDGYMGYSTVRALQGFLNKEGYSCGTPDGIFGYKTAKAFQQFLNSR